MTERTGAAATDSWPAAIAVALGIFALVFTEFLPVGMLPEISTSLHVSQGSAGLVVTVCAISAAVAAPVVTLLIGALDRRVVFMSLTLLLTLSSGISACATSFDVLLVARAVLGVAIGGFWAVAIAATAKLVRQDRVARASTVIVGGISIGTVVSVPVGAQIALHADWHMAYVVGCALAVAVLVIQWRCIPTIAVTSPVAVRDFLALFRSPRIVGVLIASIFVIGGHFASYTFINPFLRIITGLNPSTVTELLLGYGLLTVAGNFIGGIFIGRHLLPTFRVFAVTVGFALLLMAVFGQQPAVVIVALILWSVAWGAVPLGTQLVLYDAARNGFSLEATQALYTSIAQVAIGIGSLAGVVAVNALGLDSAPWMGAAGLALGVALLMVIKRPKVRPPWSLIIPSPKLASENMSQQTEQDTVTGKARDELGWSRRPRG